MGNQMNTTNDIRCREVCTSVFDSLSFWAATTPEKTGLSILGDGENVTESVTFSQLEKQAFRTATKLTEMELKGLPVMILLPTSIDFSFAFYGCLASGVIAVPASAPNSKKPRSWKTLEAIIEAAGIKHIIVSRIQFVTLSLLQENDSIFEGCCFLVIDDLLNSEGVDSEGVGVEGQAGRLTRPNMKDVAFLQFTSGSTGKPKGVIVTQNNLKSMQDMMDTSIFHESAETCVSWLPLYHDMGLGVMVRCLYAGMHTVLMPPVAFIQKPIRWVKAISTYGAHTSGGPNFAYELLADIMRNDATLDLDLSRWKMAYCGAEPIRAKTIEGFVESAERFGFPPSGMLACYGLAEAVVAVSFLEMSSSIRTVCVEQGALEKSVFTPSTPSLNAAEETQRKDANTIRLVSCGAVFEAISVAIVHPQDGRICDSGEIGEIWLKGDNISEGYWNNEVATKETFNHSLPSGEGGYMRTGDLGVFNDGHLYVTGRTKDLIIINGRNIYPQDLEETAQNSNSALRRNNGVAFSYEVNGKENIVLIQEIDKQYLDEFDAATAFKNVVAHISDVFSLNISEIVFIAPATLMKTSSGKVQRQFTKKAFLDDKLVSLARWKTAEVKRVSSSILLNEEERVQIKNGNQKILEKLLQTVVANYVDVPTDEILFTKPLSEFGLESVTVIQFMEQISDIMGMELDQTVFWENPSIRELALYIITQSLKLSQKYEINSGPESVVDELYSANMLSDDEIESLSDEEALLLLLEES